MNCLQHLLGHREVGDDAVLHRADRDDVARRAAEHALGFPADRGDGTRAAGAAVLPDRDDRRLVEHDALPARIDQRIGRTQIYREIVGENAAQELEHVPVSSPVNKRANVTSVPRAYKPKTVRAC
jgi:hypothetical protein